MEAAETTFREDHSSDRIIYAPCILQGILIHCILRGLEVLVLRYASVVYLYRSLCKRSRFLFEFRTDCSGYLRAIERRYMVSSPVNDTVSSRDTLSLTLYLR